MAASSTETEEKQPDGSVVEITGKSYLKGDARLQRR